ncbi:MAG: exodeoxyribonuclease VII large subunit, partial [Actinomycetota bacterium]
ATAVVERDAGRTASATRVHLLTSGRHLDAVESQVRVLDPANTLARGYSITRRDDGALVRKVADVAPGDELLTTLADGTLRSTAS